MSCGGKSKRDDGRGDGGVETKLVCAVLFPLFPPFLSPLINLLQAQRMNGDSVAQAITASLAVSSRRIIDVRQHQLPTLRAASSQEQLAALEAELTATLEAVREQLQEAKLEAADVEQAAQRTQVNQSIVQLQRDYDE